MSNLSQQQLADILDQLRHSRALILHDAEAFPRAVLGLEHIAQVAGASVGIGLGRSRAKIFELLRDEDDQLQAEARSLFEVVRQARNMAVHDGAWVRHRSSQLVDFILLLEEAVLRQLTFVEEVMVRSAIIAEPWHQLAQVRRTMLSNSFSFLPLLLGHWRLLADEAIVAITRGETERERRARLSLSVKDAVENHKMRLMDADVAPPRDLVANVVAQSRSWPLLVTDNGESNGRLLGILTPFDLL